MRKGIHPDYQEVVFMDSATGAKFLAGSTLKFHQIHTHSTLASKSLHKQMVVSKNSTRSTVCLQRTNNSWFLPKEQPTLDCSFFYV